MTKRIISTILTLLIILSSVGSFGYASTIGKADSIFYEDFESFDKANFTSYSDASAPIESDKNSKVMAVKTAKDDKDWPQKTLNISNDAVIEFDVKNAGKGASKVYASFDGGAYVELFCMLSDGRGPLLRDKGNVPYFFFNSSDAKPNHAEWNNIQINLNLSSGTITASINGKAVAKLFDREYKEHANVPAMGKTLTGLKFGSQQNDFSDSDKTFYDNIKIYNAGTVGTATQTPTITTPVVSENTGVPGGTAVVEGTDADDFDYSVNIGKLNALGIISSDIASYKRADTLTRAQFVIAAMKAIGAKSGYAAENSFTDISDANVAAYVNMAVNMGAISGVGDGKFDPDSKISLNEAVKVMTSLLGYEPKARENGGYPSGYLLVANENKLLKGINMASGSQLVNMKDMSTLIVNCLTAPMMTRVSYGDKEIYDTSDKSRNLLYLYHKLVEVEMEVVYVDSKKNEIDVRKFGDSVNFHYDVNKNVNIKNIEGTRQYLWIDEDDEIFYMSPYKKYSTVYGYISEYNNGDTREAVAPNDIDNISFSNFAGYIDTDTDFIMTDNDSDVDDATQIILNGKFARAIIADNKLQRLDIYREYGYESPLEGGIITSIADDEIKYIGGTNSYLGISEIDEVDKVVTVIDGYEASYSDLKNGMLMDYCVLSGKLIIIASSKQYTGTLNEFSEETMVLGSTAVPVASGRTIYVSTDNGVEYKDDFDIYNALGAEVVAYTDMSGAVRYLNTTSANEFIGIVSGAKKDNVLDDGDEFLRVLKSNGSSLEEKVYEVNLTDKTIYYPEITYAQAAATAKKIDGSGIYKFTVNGDKITKIVKPDTTSYNAVSGDYTFDYRFTRINIGTSLYLPINVNQIFVLKNYKGEFEPRLVAWKELQSKKVTNNNVKFIAENTKPLAEFIAFTEVPENIYTDSAAYGLVTDVKKTAADDEKYIKYSVSRNGTATEFTVLEENKYKVNGNDLSKFDYIWYKGGPELYKDTQPISISGAIPIGNADWSTLNGSAAGEAYFRDVGTYITIKNNHLKSSLNGEIKWSTLNGTYDVYAVNADHTKFTKGTLEEAVGRHIYIVEAASLVRAVFYVK